MSTAYAVSMAVHRVKEGPEWHEDETLADPRFLAFMDKVIAEPHPEFESALMQDPQSRIGKAEIVARGKTFTEERRYRKGSPATPETRMSDTELVAKFAHNARRVLTAEAIDGVAQTILELDKLEDVCDLTRMW
jgi:2-methylcitrate dehydratase PrpD